MSQFDVLQTISDDSFMKIAAHMQLQKAVSAFALVVMDRRPTGRFRFPNFNQHRTYPVVRARQHSASRRATG